MIDKVFRTLRHKVKRRLLHTNTSFSRLNCKLSDLEKERLLKIENEVKGNLVCYENSNEDTALTYPLLVGGADLSYFEGTQYCSQAIVCYVVAQYRLPHQIKPEIIYEKWKEVNVDIPYVQGSGFFWARESQPVIDLVQEQMRREPAKTPNYLLIDGNGRFHVRKFGLACKVGTELDLPTIGIAKNYDCLHSIMKGGNYTQEHQNLRNQFKDLQDGDHLELKHPSDNEVVGYAIKPEFHIDSFPHLYHCKAEKPLFVSVGHKVSLLKAKTVALRTARLHRVPEPIRQSDIISRREVKNTINCLN